MSQLYNIELPNADAQSATDRIAAQIEQAGLLEAGGIATEKIAADDIDLTITGQFRYGERFSRKAAREIESLAAGSYDAVELYGPEDSEVDSLEGYYEVADVDTNPAHPTDKDVYEYTVGLRETGTRETHWRAVRTTVETVDTLFTGTDTSLLAVSADASKTQWFDIEQGTELATAVDSVESEYGTVERYDPADSTFENPTLIYEVPFGTEYLTDAIVYDDRNREKFWTFDDGTSSIDVNQWAHVYHTAWEFDGTPLIDTGHLRVWFGIPFGNDELVVEDGETYVIEDGETEVWGEVTVEGTGEIDVQGDGELIVIGGLGMYAERWDDTAGEWDHVPLTDGPWSLLDADFTQIGPGEVTVQLLWSDGSALARVNGIFDRGDDSVLWVRPDNEDYVILDTYSLDVAAGETFTVASGETYRYLRGDTQGTLDIQGTLIGDPGNEFPEAVADVLRPLARETDTNVAPAQTVVARSETRS